MIKDKLKAIVKYKWLAIIVSALVVAFVIFYYVSSCSRNSSISFGTDNRIDITPEQIRSIEAIGQWEFLSVSDEEFVDTVRRGFLSEYKLARIYVGTLRLGVDMKKVNKGWLKVSGDTLVARIPRIQLLDHRFIDEAATRSFYENGSWSAADREAMYQRAYRQMIARCLTSENIATAKNNANEQFLKLFHSMEFKNVRIIFEK
jgi:hypothetical protein